LSRALAEAKASFCEESEMNIDDIQALDALLSSFRTVETEEQGDGRTGEGIAHSSPELNKRGARILEKSSCGRKVKG
jgi:hypothetical protein